MHAWGGTVLSCTLSHTYTHARAHVRVLSRPSRNIVLLLLLSLSIYLQHAKSFVDSSSSYVQDDLAVSSAQAFRSGLPNYLRLWPRVLRLGETSAKHLLRLKQVPVLIPFGGHYTDTGHY